jgi:CBS domain-containing protein
MTELTKVERTASATPNDGPADSPLCFAETQMVVQDIMNRNVTTVSPAESLFATARHMSTHDVSCVVVVDAGTVVGIFTQKDWMQSVALEQTDWSELPVSERMSSPVVVAPPDLPVLQAGQTLKAKHIKHLPIVAEQQLVGIVTQTDVTRGLVYLTPLQRVCEVMSPKVATVGMETTVADAARTMWFQSISCVIVMHLNEPVGIVSQTDILMRVILPRKDAADTAVSEVMSSPILPIPPDYSIFTASRIMDKMHIHRLVVRDGGQVCGIVSQTDILQAVERRLAEDEERRRLPVCSDMPAFMLDREGVITYVNPAFLRLLDSEAYDEVSGTAFLGEHLWVRSQDEKLLLQTLRAGRSDLLRAVMRTRTNATKPILLLLAALKNDTEGIVGWQGVAWRQD